MTIERRLILYVTDWEITYVRERDPLHCAPRISGKSNFRAWIKSSKATKINVLNRHEGDWHDKKLEWIKKRLHLLKR